MEDEWWKEIFHKFKYQIGYIFAKRQVVETKSNPELAQPGLFAEEKKCALLLGWVRELRTISNAAELPET